MDWTCNDKIWIAKKMWMFIQIWSLKQFSWQPNPPQLQLKLMTLGLQLTPILVLALFPSFAFIDHLLCYRHCSPKRNLCEQVGLFESSKTNSLSSITWKDLKIPWLSITKHQNRKLQRMLQRRTKIHVDILGIKNRLQRRCIRVLPALSFSIGWMHFMLTCLKEVWHSIRYMWMWNLTSGIVLYCMYRKFLSCLIIVVFYYLVRWYADNRCTPNMQAEKKEGLKLFNYEELYSDISTRFQELLCLKCYVVDKAKGAGPLIFLHLSQGTSVQL